MAKLSLEEKQRAVVVALEKAFREKVREGISPLRLFETFLVVYYFSAAPALIFFVCLECENCGKVTPLHLGKILGDVSCCRCDERYTHSNRVVVPASLVQKSLYSLDYSRKLKWFVKMLKECVKRVKDYGLVDSDRYEYDFLFLWVQYIEESKEYRKEVKEKNAKTSV